MVKTHGSAQFDSICQPSHIPARKECHGEGRCTATGDSAMCLRQPPLVTREAFHVGEKNTRSGRENEREQKQNGHLDADRKPAIRRTGRQDEFV